MEPQAIWLSAYYNSETLTSIIDCTLSCTQLIYFQATSSVPKADNYMQPLQNYEKLHMVFKKPWVSALNQRTFRVYCQLLHASIRCRTDANNYAALHTDEDKSILIG